MESSFGMWAFFFTLMLLALINIIWRGNKPFMIQPDEKDYWLKDLKIQTFLCCFASAAIGIGVFLDYSNSSTAEHIMMWICLIIFITTVILYVVRKKRLS